MVAIKKAKINSFSDVNGIPCAALREIKVLQELKGQEHIVELKDVFYIKKTVYLVLEFLEVDLFHFIRNQQVTLKDEHIKCIIKQVL